MLKKLVGKLSVNPKKKYHSRSLSKIDMIVIHATDRDWDIQTLNKYDVEGRIYLGNDKWDINHINSRGLPAITYHDVIMRDGTMNQCLDLKTVSWHAGGFNTRSLAIALMYEATNPDTKRPGVGSRFTPTDKQLAALYLRARDHLLNLGLDPSAIVGHRELKGTGWFWRKGHKQLRKTCPGLNVDMDLVRHKVTRKVQLWLRQKDLYDGKIDGIWGSKSEKAMYEHSINKEEK